MRKLATIRKIAEIRPIERADAIECAIVDGWTVVVRKGDFEAGDLAIYCEIDSWIPDSLFSLGKNPREFNGVLGDRLRTIKLRGQLSQGLLLDTSVAENIIAPGEFYFFEEGNDVTELLGIQKWEAPIPTCLAGIVKGNFPSLVPKTDQERVQNLPKDFQIHNLTWEVTEKLDGSSCTMYLSTEGEFEVCSRNLSLKKDENNSFWKIAIANDVEQRMIDFGFHGLAIQGELIGEGIQGNPYKLKGQEFYIFDIYDTVTKQYRSSDHRRNIAWILNLNHCPILIDKYCINTLESTLVMSEGKSQLNSKAEREGIVFKCIENPSISFKAISNKFLLKEEK